MSERDERTERLARAIWAAFDFARCHDRWVPWEHLPDETRAMLREQADAAPDDGDEALLRRALAGGFRVLFRVRGDRVGCTLRISGSATDPAWRWFDGEADDPASALADALGNAEAGLARAAPAGDAS